MSVIRNYNNLIKNKGTRRVKKLIEDMLNESSNEYEIAINEYYIAKSTKNSINYVDK
jgi:sugar-specific transcriptional regulator TrmB